jgi:MGT family glycosyltransferase
VTKVLWFSIPALGHIIPTLPVVGELRRRGHEVTYYGTDDNRASIELSGARFAGYPPGVLSMREIADGTTRIVHPGHMMLVKSHQLIPFARAEIGREAPDLIVYDHMAIWAGIAARLADVPTAATFPMMVPAGPRLRLGLRSTARWRLSSVVSRRLMARERRRLSESLGIEAIRDPQFGVIADKNLVFVSPELNPGSSALDDRFVLVGPSFDDRTTEVVGSFDGRTTEAASWTAPPGDGPLVLVSLGTLHKGSSKFYGEVFAAFRDHPARFVMYGGPDIAQHPLAPFPDNFSVSSSFLPQMRILAECQAFISHGGMGSVQNGLHHGVPEVIVPQFVEQAMNGRRVAELGAGVVLGDQPPYGRVKAATLRRALDAVLTGDELRRRAHQLGDAGRVAGGYTRAADEIERLLPQG